MDSSNTELLKKKIARSTQRAVGSYLWGKVLKTVMLSDSPLTSIGTLTTPLLKMLREEPSHLAGENGSSHLGVTGQNISFHVCRISSCVSYGICSGLPRLHYLDSTQFPLVGQRLASTSTSSPLLTFGDPAPAQQHAPLGRRSPASVLNQERSSVKSGGTGRRFTSKGRPKGAGGPREISQLPVSILLLCVNFIIS